MLLSFRRNLLRNVGIYLGRNRILGALVVCYSTGELTPEVNCISGQCTCCTATYWGNAKPIGFDQIQVLQCFGLLSGDKRKETWMVRL